MAKQSTREIFAKRISAQPGLVDRLLDLLASIPPTQEVRSDQPAVSARRIARRAAVKSASAAGALALPPGPLGWLTIAPELYAVWKIQAQMVSDIAGVHGKHAQLDREQMLYCLFSHTAAKAIQDLVIRVGQRYLVRRAPLPALYAIVNKIAIRVAQRSVGRMFSRWLPAVGALGVAGYVYVDTGRVADAAMALFAGEVTIENDAPEQQPSTHSRAVTSTPKRTSKRTSTVKSEPDKAKPDAAKPDKAKPDKAKPDKAKPDKVRRLRGSAEADADAAAGKPAKAKSSPAAGAGRIKRTPAERA